MKLTGPSSPLTFLRFWAAPLFAVALSAITLSVFLMVQPHSYEAGFPAFFCFLPMAFFFGAQAQVESQKQVRVLQQRIEQLEAHAALSLA